MADRKHDDDEELTRDTPVKVDLPFDEALRRLVQPKRQATSDDESDSEDDSR
jgi:hypothetical protein